MRRIVYAPRLQSRPSPYIRNIPVEVILDRSDGMPARCVVNLDDITTLPKVLIKQRITALSTEKIQQVDSSAIRFCFSWTWTNRPVTLYQNGSTYRGRRL